MAFNLPLDHPVWSIDSAIGPTDKGVNMRIWIVRLHLYGGLLCCSYLLLFGISSLLFNHHPEFAEPGGRTITWERDLTPGKWADDAAEAKAIHQELGLIGWAYDEHRQRNGDLLFTASRPGKVYHIV